MSNNDHPNLQEIALLRDLPEIKLQQLHSMLRPRAFKAGTNILNVEQEGEAVYIVVSGSVRVYIQRPSGAEVILNILGPGEVLGEISAIDKGTHSASVVALETTRFLRMERDDFCACLDTIPEINRNLVRILTRRMRRLTDQAEALATLDVYGRVARQILIFAQDYGRRTADDGILVPVRLTQRDLAGLTGSCRERVNRAMSFYKKHHYISVGPNLYITIHDYEALAQRCR